MATDPVSETADQQTANRQLRDQAALVLQQDALGRSHMIEQLFRFLLACSLEGRAPKELEIAREVFGKGTEDNASIRIHVHRLRRKLDEFYEGKGEGLPVRLVIPKGGYRLAVVANGEEAAAPAVKARATRPWSIAAGALLILAAAVLLTWWLASRPDDADAPLVEARASALWQPVVNNGRRTAIVVGDYYIFGERDQDGDITRLIREFDVNSARDLDERAKADPQRAANYVDLGLDYLPVGIGNALRVVAPIVRRNDHSIVPTMVVQASQLTPEMVKYTNIVYLGYLSGMASLRDPMFSGSRYAVGASYDEIIDRSTGRHYLAGSHLEQAGDTPSRDYALIASFTGVSGNRIVVIGGTRDAALMQAAEFATRPDALAEIAKAAGGQDFEALLVIESLHNVGLRARLLAAGPRRRETEWFGPPQHFPDSSPGDSPPTSNAAR